MGSLNDFWNTSQRANDFLRTGITNDTVRSGGNFNRGPLSSDNGYSPNVGNDTSDLGAGSGCVSTSQCPSGWGCVNGVCVQLNNGISGGSNTPGGGGVCDPGDSESPCNSGGPNSCQQTPQCGDTDDEARDCCGTRCCSFGSASSARPGVHCFCGECPPLPGCTSFCDSYLKANGVVGPGCSEGFDGNSCTGCTECDGNTGGECKPIFIGADCWCSGEECNAAGCETCVTDSESDDYGECALDPSNCQQCATITNHVCPCGFAFLGQPVLPPITVCKPYGEGGPMPINLAQQEAARQCDEICSGDGGGEDPCAPKTSNSTYCTDTGTGTASCPAGSTQTGSLEVGGESCVFCETKDYSDLPESCKDCDCNCNNDCPACQLCGANGTCYPDPACDPITDGVLIGTYPNGAQEGVFGNCANGVYVESWEVNEEGPCCPGADNGSCGCPDAVPGSCNPYYACLPQEPGEEGQVVQVYAAFAPQPCYVYTQGAWWSSGRDCVGCPCNDTPSQIYDVSATGSDGSEMNNYRYGRDVGYTVTLVSCSDL